MMERTLAWGSLLSILGLFALIYLGETNVLVSSSPHYLAGLAVAAVTAAGWVMIWVGLIAGSN